MPRVGVTLTLPAGHEAFAWYGHGPHESYVDRKQSARLDVYRGTVDDQYVPYVKPQENGNKTDVRWMAFLDNNGDGLMVSAVEAPLSIGARFYSRKAMETSKYSFQMERSPAIHVNIDALQAGIGGNTSWGATPLPDYLLTKRKYGYRYRLAPVSSGQVEKTAGNNRLARK